jgi:hypothetical protein
VVDHACLIRMIVQITKVSLRRTNDSCRDYAFNSVSPEPLQRKIPEKKTGMDMEARAST